MAYKSYSEVKNAYNRLYDAGVVSESLPDWSRDMNRATGTQDYSEGLSDNWVKRTSSWIDDLIEKTGVPYATGQFGEAVGGLVGAPEIGKDIGANFGRMAVNVAPMLLLPGPGWLMTGARLGGMAALAGAEAYTKTGSVASGLTTGALNAVMPGISNLAEQAVLKRVGGKLVEGTLLGADKTTQAFKRYYAQSLPQGLAAYTGGQIAGAGVGVAADVGQQVLSGNDVEISPTEQLLNLTLGQLPFAAVHLTKGGRVPFGGAATRAEIAKVEGAIQTSKNVIELQQMKDALAERDNKSTLADVPDYALEVKEPSPTDVARKNYLINQLRQKQHDEKTEGTPLSLDEWHKDTEEINKLVRETGLVDGNIRGAKVDDKTERFQLIAKEVIYKPETGWRMVIAADDPRNGEYAGKKVDWSTLHEPEAQPADIEGYLVYSVPKGYHDTKPPSPGWIDRQSRRLEGHPDLPLQPNEIVDANSEIRQIEQMIRSAKDDDDFRASILKLNTVRQAYGWRPIDDVEIGARQKLWADKAVEGAMLSEKDAFRNALEQTRREVQARDSARVETELEQQRRLAKDELDKATDLDDVTAQAIAQKKIEELDSQMTDLSPKAKRAREAASWEKIMKDSEAGPEVKPENALVAKGVVELYNTFSSSGKARYNEITTGGLWEKKLHEWKEEGSGNIELLKAKFAKAIATGEGLKGRVQKKETYEPPPAEPVAVIPGSQQGLVKDLDWKKVGMSDYTVPIYRAEGAENQSLESGIHHAVYPEHAEEFMKPGRALVTKQLNPDAHGFVSSSSKITLLDQFGLMNPDDYLAASDADPEGTHAHADKLLARYLRDKGYDFYVFDDAGMGGDPEIVVINKNAYATPKTEAVVMKPPPVKLDPTIEKALDVPVKPETVPIKQTVYENALKVTEGTEHASDREMFLDFWQLGKKAFQAKYKMDADDYNDWSTQPHVEEWNYDLKDLTVDRNAAPNSVHRPRKRTKEFVPIRPTEKEFVARVGTTGETLLASLRASKDPFMASLATDLGKYGEALKRVVVRVKDMTPESHAAWLPDGRIQINLNKDHIYSSSYSQEHMLMHELLHGLSQHEINNPLNAKHVAAFSDMRVRMISLLPEGLKKAYREISSADNWTPGVDWYSRYAKGHAEWKELEDTISRHFQLGDVNNHANLLYGLLNNDEFLTQGFTSKPMKDYLRSHKASDGQTYFHKFVNWVKDLTGLGTAIKGTAFEEFLSYSDKILDSGNYVASIHNYGERYFTSKGYGVEQAREMTGHGVGLLKNAKFEKLTPDSVVQHLYARYVSESAHRAEVDVNKLFMTDPTPTVNLLAEHQYPPDMTGTSMLASDLLTGKADPLILDLLDPKVADYVYARSRDVDDIVDMLRAATDKDVKGLVNVDADDLKPTIAGTLNKTKKILDLERKFAKTTGELQGLVKVSPAGYMDDVVTNPAPGGLYIDPTEPPKRQIGWISNIFGSAKDFAKDSPEFAELTAKAHQLLANKHQMETTALKPLVSKIDPLTGEETIYDKKGKELSDPTVEKAVNKWMYQNQEQGKETGVVMLPRDNATIKEILRNVPPAKQQAVIDKVEGQVRSIQIAQKQTIEKMTDVSVIDAAALIAKSTGQSATQNVKIADAMNRALSMDISDPAQMQQMQVLLDNVQRTVGDVGTFNTLLQFMQNQKEIIKTHEEHFAANPAWATAQRFGKFELEYRKGDKVYFDKVNSRKEAEQKVADFGGQIVRFERTAETDDTAAAIFNNRDTPRQLARLRELEANKYEILSHVYEPEVIDDMRRNSAVEQYAVEAAYAGGVKGVKVHPRRLSKGAEEISWMNNHVNWIGQNASHWTREKFKAQARLLMSQPGLQDRPDLLNKARQFVSQMLSADPEVGKVATRVTSTWLLGGNFASTIVNGTQLMTRGVAELTNITGKPLQSYKRVLNTYKEMMDVAQGKGWAGPDHEWVVKQMQDEGIMGTSVFDEGTMQQEKTATNLKRAIAKNRPQSFGHFMGTLAGQYSNVSMMAFKSMERVNNTGAVLSAFDIFRERGLNRQDAYTKALEFNRTVNDVGGKANRPIGLFSGTDKFSRSAAMIGTSMQSYFLGSMFQLGHYIKKGTYGGSSLTPAERWSARKAAVQMLATQAVAAGGLGLPLVSSAVAVLEQMFPDLEPGRKLRETVHGLITQFITEDEENGKALTDLAMAGVPSMLGWDWQSRLSMGTLPGISEINGMQPGLIAMAPFNVVSQFVKGVGGAVEGDRAKAMNLFPPGVKKIVDLATAGFKARDYNGKPIMDVTPGETVGVALGFTPKSVKDHREAQRAVTRAKEVQDAEKQKFTKSLVSLIEEGNFDAVKHNLNERARTDPTFDPQAGARQVASAAVEMAFPKDLRRSAKDSAVLKTYNIPESQPNEVQRETYKIQILQQLGVSFRPKDVQKAQIMDMLREQNPNASRYELSREAEKVQGKLKQQQMLPEPAL